MPPDETAQESRSAHQNLRHLRPALRLAQEMGARLGGGQALFRPLPVRCQGQAMTGRLWLVPGDQLTRGLASLADLDPATDVVLMVDVAAGHRQLRAAGQ